MNDDDIIKDDTKEDTSRPKNAMFRPNGCDINDMFLMLMNFANCIMIMVL